MPGYRENSELLSGYDTGKSLKTGSGDNVEDNQEGYQKDKDCSFRLFNQ